MSVSKKSGEIKKGSQTQESLEAPKTSLKASLPASLPEEPPGRASLGSGKKSFPPEGLAEIIGSAKTSLPREQLAKTSTGSEKTSLPREQLAKINTGSEKTSLPREQLAKISTGSEKTSLPREQQGKTSIDSTKSILRPKSNARFSVDSNGSSLPGELKENKTSLGSAKLSLPRKSAAITSFKASSEDAVRTSADKTLEVTDAARSSLKRPSALSSRPPYEADETTKRSSAPKESITRSKHGSGGLTLGPSQGSIGGRSLSRTSKGTSSGLGHGKRSTLQPQPSFHSYYEHPGEDQYMVPPPVYEAGGMPMVHDQEIPGEYQEPTQVRTSVPLDDPCAAICEDGLPCDDDKDDDEDDEDEDDFCENQLEPNYKLNDFLRAKQYFMSKSTLSGISLYDHLSELIRKLLDNRAPNNPVDFIEELSFNLKRYRFGLPKDMIQDSYFLSPHVINEAQNIVRHWKKNAMWSTEGRLASEDTPTFGGFPNLLRLQYYLEQINAGLPREEMFRIALILREIQIRYPSMPRVRFWGKIFAIKNNYYVFESELETNQELEDTFKPLPLTPPEKLLSQDDDPYFAIPGAGATFQRAGNAVTDPEILQLYQLTKAEGSLVPPNSAGGDEVLGERLAYFQDTTQEKDLSKWQEFQMELMTGFPIPKIEEVKFVPPEQVGQGVNRRQFFVVIEPLSSRTTPESVSMPNPWDNLNVFETGGTGLQIIPLGSVTPQQINVSREVRWFLTGQLDAKVKTVPPFPGCEADYLRALLARITAATTVSPKGYFSGKKAKDEEEDLGEEEEDVEEEEDEDQAGEGDIVYPKLKFRPTDIAALTTTPPHLWVHHASYILKQGRTKWFDMNPKKKPTDEELGEDEEEADEEEEEEGGANKEFGPELFSPLSEDKALDNSNPWAVRASSTIFKEFQVAYVRSNLWPGTHALCTIKGKVENIYLGDGLKFYPRSYAPFVPEEPQTEYKEGPEIKEIDDPTVEAEQEWLAKLQLAEIADIEPKFVDNEVEGEGEEEEEEEEEDEED